MKTFQKLIASILIIGLVLSLGFNIFLLKPKTAQAVLPVGDVAFQPTATIKDLLLDIIAHTITQVFLNILKQKIMNWGMGRTSDAMQPYQVVDWKVFFAEAANRGAALFIEEFEGVFDFAEGACEKGLKIKQALLNLGFGYYNTELPTYFQYARPNLQSLLGDNCQEFVNSGYSLLTGGWNGWFGLSIVPQNNIFDQVLMAESARRTAEQEEKEAADKQTAASGGFKNEETTTQTNVEACKQRCASAGPPDPKCLANCENLPGVIIQTQLKNWGGDINKLMTDALGADMERLIGVDEITELLQVLYSALVNKALNIGLGFASSIFSSGSSPDRTRVETRTTYSYQRAFEREQTAEDRKDIRSQTLTNILKSIQQLSRSITVCDDADALMKYDDYTKYVGDIFNNSVESLYIGLKGVNLKPDFEVLDPRFAPYTVYGYSWGQVPVRKFPEKCKNITDQLKLGDRATCRSIKSGLEPASVSYSLIEEKCEECMYDHDALMCPPEPYPPQPYPSSGNEPWNEDILKYKAEFYNACMRPYNTVLNRCEDCLKKVDEKCSQLDTKKREEQCILNQCSNYADLEVVSPPVDGLDFRDKCLIEEKKDACYVCLKEYFMPATYCEQTQDYVARSIIKYPALVKKVRKGFLVADHEIWLGPYDKYWDDVGGECDNNDEKENIDLAIICRILPDFKYNGQKLCETQCSKAGLTGQALIDALKDIADFRPHGKDCGSYKVPVGGKETWAPVNDGVFHLRGKCCAALWQHDDDKYAVCIGAGSTSYCGDGKKDSNEECDDGNNINGDGCSAICEIESSEVAGVCLDGETEEGVTREDEGEKGGHRLSAMSLKGTATDPNFWKKHGFINVVHTSETYQSYDCVILRPFHTSLWTNGKYVVTKPWCDAVRKEWVQGGSVYFSDVNGDGKFSDQFVNDEGFGADFLGYCLDGAGNPKDPKPKDIIGTNPTECSLEKSDSTDPDTGKWHQVCCGMPGTPRYQEYKLSIKNQRITLYEMLNLTDPGNDNYPKKLICQALGVDVDKKCPEALTTVVTGGVWEVVGWGKAAGEICICMNPPCNNPPCTDAETSADGKGCEAKCEKCQ